MSFKEVKVVYLPDGASGAEFIKFEHPRSGLVQSFLICGEELYEIEVFNLNNPHSSKNYKTTKKDNKLIRSLILENHDNGKGGIVLEQEEVYLSKKFNFVYCFISYFWDKNFERFKTIEDLIDLINEKYPSEIPEAIISKSLRLISEVIVEGDEEFFKITKDKILEFLKNKVELISNGFPESIYNQLIKPIINPIDINSEIPEDISKLSKLKYSIYLISSYLNNEVQDFLFNEYKFSELDEYINKLEEEKRSKKLAAEQINELNSINSNNKRSLDKAVKKGPIKKKPTVKLRSGPLDGFFKKK